MLVLLSLGVSVRSLRLLVEGGAGGDGKAGSIGVKTRG